MSILREEFESVEKLLLFVDQNYRSEQNFEEIKVVIKSGYENYLLPTTKKKTALTSKEGYIDWIFNKYNNAYNSRTIVKVGKPMSTKPDFVIDLILQTSLNKTSEEVEAIVRNHRQSMYAETLVGNLLEEYIDERLKGTKWVCCYGETLQKCDFCHPDGRLIQIKNRSNTENSSSSKIRAGTEIEKWFRINATSGKTYWERLYSVFGGTDKIIDGQAIEFSEEDFQHFVRNVISKNKKCVYIEEE